MIENDLVVGALQAAANQCVMDSFEELVADLFETRYGPNREKDVNAAVGNFNDRMTAIVKAFELAVEALNQRKSEGVSQ